MSFFTTSTTGFLAAETFVVPSNSSTGPALIASAGVTLLHVDELSAAAMEAGLKALRSRPAESRRAAWCRIALQQSFAAAELTAWGKKMIAFAGVELLVTSGPGSRELAVAARDAGISLGRVIVCRDDALARNVLCDGLGPGDSVLALGVDADNCRKLAERLSWRFEGSALKSRLPQRQAAGAV